MDTFETACAIHNREFCVNKMSVESFVNQHIQLLEKEREAEIEETR